MSTPAQSPFVCVDRLEEAQIADLFALYQREWWTQGRTLEETRRMLGGSDLLFGICIVDSRRLIAFARVLTDYVFKALIFDVIVDGAYRTQGVGRLLLERIVAHPALSPVQHIELYCHPTMTAFYARWGFSADLGGVVLLRSTHPHVTR